MTKSKKQSVKSETTLVAFLLDRTGSMASVKQETIGGFNGYLDELLKKPESKNIRFHFTQFDTVSTDTIHDGVPLKEVDKLTDKTFIPRGMTNLYDAIGNTINAIQEKAKGQKVLFVTLTDGAENSSSEWTDQSVKTLIKEKEDKDKWTFAYIGIGPEAWANNARLSAGTIGASNVLRATTGKNTLKAYGHVVQATMMRASTKGGQSLKACFKGVQLDQE